MSDYKTVKLGNLCTITTGKLDANAMTEDGQYMFFTCSKENNKTEDIVGRIFGSLYTLQEYSKLIDNRLGE